MKNPKSNESEPPKDFFFDAVSYAHDSLCILYSLYTLYTLYALYTLIHTVRNCFATEPYQCITTTTRQSYRQRRGSGDKRIRGSGEMG